MARAIGGIFLLHFPSARAAQALPGTVPCGARTFLGMLAHDATVWPAPPSTILRLSPPSIGESRDQVQLFETWSLDSGWGCRCRGNSIRFGRGRRCKTRAKASASGRGRRYKGISSAAWFRVLLQHAGAVHPCTARTKSPCSDVLRRDGWPGFAGLRQQHRRRHVASVPARRSRGHSPGERRGSAGIGRKQAMDGLRSPVGAMDGGIRRCARSPHRRGSPQSRQTPCFEATRPRLPPKPTNPVL